MDKPVAIKKLKRVVVKEELVTLTGDIQKAIILNQLIYWSERVHDLDKFILEEKTRAEQNGLDVHMELTGGWIYKSAEELSEETMLKLSPSNLRLRKHVKDLVDNGWIDERTNPNLKWDRTKQYRVNLLKIHTDLLKLGYHLQDYRVPINLDVPFSKIAVRIVPSVVGVDYNNSCNEQINQLIGQNNRLREMLKEKDLDYQKKITELNEKDRRCASLATAVNRLKGKRRESL